ncbi:hypothetical protein [Mycobacteroides salmoniphilum]|uniref:Helix-turn-helix domain-containing protein n=1 Tax=Mycobacteroides salmoniphilum TaxID=404941 RepID=A0A4R8SVC7_9MYCO|nr:hypothetical protein [Mycobacteroides salmoniphilum]TEA06272.1 hypothetical protein CCUG60884_01410 [Mycobacteroides salmoniphilum]
MKFNKWKWFDLVVADSRIPAGEKIVLVRQVVKAVLNGGDTFRVRQQLVAASTATNERTVQRAYKRAIELGYLELVAERLRGSEGKSDTYRLLMPADSAVGEVPDKKSGTSAKSTRLLVEEYPTNSPKVPDTANAPTSENGTPISSLEKFLGEGAASPPPAPLLDPLGQPRCRKHFGVENPPDCPPCGLERERKEALDRFTAERIEAEHRAIRAAIDSCPNKCDQAGRLDDLTDCSLHPNFRQNRAVA